jgi:hypothetical protein
MIASVFAFYYTFGGFYHLFDFIPRGNSPTVSFHWGIPSPPRWEGLNMKEAAKLSSSREDRGKQKTLDKRTTRQTKGVKLLGAEQRAEVTPARDKERPAQSCGRRSLKEEISRQH